jgi:hypothetical protein
VIGDTEMRVRPGHHGTLESRSPTGAFMARFEDDGETGYVYAVDLGREHGSKIIEAIQIYVAREDGEVGEILVELRWSGNGNRVALALDGELQVAFDFAAEVACALSAFPPPADDRWKRVRARSAAEIAAFLERPAQGAQ